MMDKSDSESFIASKISRHKFAVFIGVAVIISILLVLASLSLYRSSGTLQLDLSRPGYEDIRDQVQSEERFETYPATGELNKDALDEFDELYSAKLNEVESVDAFSSDVLSPEALQIDQKSAQQDVVDTQN